MGSDKIGVNEGARVKMRMQDEQARRKAGEAIKVYFNAANAEWYHSLPDGTRAAVINAALDDYRDRKQMRIATATQLITLAEQMAQVHGAEPVALRLAAEMLLE